MIYQSSIVKTNHKVIMFFTKVKKKPLDRVEHNKINTKKIVSKIKKSLLTFIFTPGFMVNS